MEIQKYIEKIKDWRRPKYIGAKHVLSLLLSIFLPILLIEIYLNKTSYPFQNCKDIHTSAEYYLGLFDSETGWSYKPKISYYDGKERFEYHFNEDGIRIRMPNTGVNYEKPRIVFIGDSVTFGEELSYNDTFAAQINHLLKDKFEIINLGVQGYGTDQALLRLKKFAQDLDPDYIVYTFIADDKNRNVNYDRRLHVKCFEFAGTKPLFSLKNDQLIQVGFPKQYDEVDQYKVPLFLSHSWQNFEEQVYRKNEFDVALTKALLGEIQNVAKEQKATDYYIYFDTNYNLDENNYNNYLSKKILSEDQLERTLMFVNWAEDSHDKGTKYYVNENDDLHPNASLSAMLAKRFVEKFGPNFVAQ